MMTPSAVVTVSDGVTNGTREDTSGDLAESILAAAGFEVATGASCRTSAPIESDPRVAAADHGRS